MNPGRELDALVGEKVMGCEVFIELDKYIVCRKHGHDHEWALVPWYSSRIQDAWEVVNKLKNDHPFSFMKTPGLKYWQAAFGATVGYIDGESGPHAICLSALKAVGHKFEDEK